MIIRSLAFLCLAAATLSPVVADEPIYLPATATAELIAKEGQKVVVHGITGASVKSASGANFVNFEGAEFFLVTFKSDLVHFEAGEPVDQFDGKRLAVEGVISIYQEKPQIKLTGPHQVTILSADEVFPPEVKKPAPEIKEEKPGVKKEDSEEPAMTEEEPKRKPPVDASEFFD